MTWLGMYVAVGVLVSAFLAKRRHAVSGGSQALTNLEACIAASPFELVKSLKRDRLMTMEPLRHWGLTAALWPLVLCRLILQYRPRWNEDWLEREVGAFRVRRDHLVALHSIEEVEARAVISDPLVAVPSVPFGHLSGIWRAFRQRVPGDAQLWSFQAIGDAGWGRLERKSGFAWVQGRAVLDHVVMESRLLRCDD